MRRGGAGAARQHPSTLAQTQAQVHEEDVVARQSGGNGRLCMQVSTENSHAHVRQRSPFCCARQEHTPTH